VIPYGRQRVDDPGIAEAMLDALHSSWLTTGPRVGEFEARFAEIAGTAHAVAFNNGTTALHGVVHARGVGPGDEIIVPANTFIASANCALYQGATPVFVDVEDSTLLVDPKDVEAKITSRTRGIVSVDYAGQPCDYDLLNAIAERHGIFLHADACHALGATYQGRPVGSLAATSSFSFHPVKPITTAEGGMVTTDEPEFAQKLRVFRNHGITSDFRAREAAATWEYDMVDLGYNCRLSDLQCALGISQLTRLGSFIQARQRAAAFYDDALAGLDWIAPIEIKPDRTSGYHLYVTRLGGAAADRQADLFAFMRGRGVGVHVMYKPVYLHSYYRERFGDRAGMCPNAEAAYRSMLVLPVFPQITDTELETVIARLRDFQNTELN
jgi:perosamine synthetase